jgi:hypothetical protein
MEFCIKQEHLEKNALNKILKSTHLFLLNIINLRYALSFIKLKNQK